MTNADLRMQFHKDTGKKVPMFKDICEDIGMTLEDMAEVLNGVEQACIDAEIPQWKNDDWYWQKEATDWGYDWAKPENKKFHPKYAPVYRYARDIIGCLNNYVNGWIDWNMVLNKQGGPNWFKNWCIAPIIVDEENDEVYFTPLYYVMTHFSKFIRPEAKVFKVENTDKELMVTAAENKDGTIAVVIFNEKEAQKKIKLSLFQKSVNIDIKGKTIQTIVIPKLKNKNYD